MKEIKPRDVVIGAVLIALWLVEEGLTVLITGRVHLRTTSYSVSASDILPFAMFRFGMAAMVIAGAVYYVKWMNADD